MEQTSQHPPKITWETPVFECTALKEAAFQTGPTWDGDGWDSGIIIPVK